MSTALLTGTSARGAALRGLILGLVLQALLIGAIEIAGQPVRTDVAGLLGPTPIAATGIGAVARAHP
jgi:hypothetical protein